MFEYVPSCSTRPMRVNDGEEQGNPYWFLTEEEFKSQIDDWAFVEWAYVHKTAYYGSRRKDLEDVLAKGKWAIKEIEILGLEKILESGTMDGKFVTIFMDLDDLVMTQRIFKRQPDIDAEELQKRLNSADHEREQGIKLCDFVIDAAPTIPEVVDSVMDVIENKVINK